MDYTKSNLSILKKTAKNNRNSKSFISILLFLLLLLLWLRLHFKLKNSAEAFLRSTSSNQMARRPIFSSNNSTLFVIAGTYQIPWISSYWTNKVHLIRWKRKSMTDSCCLRKLSSIICQFRGRILTENRIWIWSLRKACSIHIKRILAHAIKHPFKVELSSNQHIYNSEEENENTTQMNKIFKFLSFNM